MSQIDISPMESRRSGGWEFHAYIEGIRRDYGPYTSREEAEAVREDLVRQREERKGATR